MARGNALNARIIRVDGKYQLEIENKSDDVVTDIEIMTTEFKYDDQPAIQIRFSKGLTLQPKSKGVVQHQVLVEKDGKWAESTWHDSDMLKYLPEAELQDDTDAYYLVAGENFFQTLEIQAD